MNRDEYYAALQKNRNSLRHYGIKGQKWGERHYQNEDGTLTEEGKLRYYKTVDKLTSKKNRYQRRAEFWQTMKDIDDDFQPARVKSATVTGSMVGLAVGDMHNTYDEGMAKPIGGMAAGALAGFLVSNLSKKVRDLVLDHKINKNQKKAAKVKEQLSSLKVDDIDKHPEKVAEAMEIRKENRKAFAKKVAVGVGVVAGLAAAGVLASKAKSKIDEREYLNSLVQGTPKLNSNHESFQSIKKAAINGKYRTATAKDKADVFVQRANAQRLAVPRIEVKRKE